MIKLPQWALIVGALFSGAVGYVAVDFFSFRSEYRAELRREYVEAQTAAAELLAHLQSFSDQATGISTVTGEEKEILRERVKELYQRARQVIQMVPEADTEFNVYTDAMLKLQNAALDMTGPADAKPFIETFSKFLKAQNSFDEKVRSVQKNYIATWL